MLLFARDLRIILVDSSDSLKAWQIVEKYFPFFNNVLFLFCSQFLMSNRPLVTFGRTTKIHWGRVLRSRHSTHILSKIKQYHARTKEVGEVRITFDGSFFFFWIFERFFETWSRLVKLETRNWDDAICLWRVFCDCWFCRNYFEFWKVFHRLYFINLRHMCWRRLLIEASRKMENYVEIFSICYC